MYNVPASVSALGLDLDSEDRSGGGEEEGDESVLEFYRTMKLKKKENEKESKSKALSNNSSSSSSSSMGVSSVAFTVLDAQDPFSIISNRGQDKSKSKSKEGVGKEVHPAMRKAPVEGLFARSKVSDVSTQIKVKPFGAVRNIQVITW